MKRFILATLLVIGGCQEQTVTPDPVELTRDAVGFYCNMIVMDHPGPKAQVYEKNRKQAIWFTSVRDALAYKILPGEAQKLQAIYVHDMGQATTYEAPARDGIWIMAEQAIYVIDSRKRGGMGAKETIPFRDRAGAEKFTHKFGGNIVAYADLPHDYILGDEDEYGATEYNPLENDIAENE